MKTKILLLSLFLLISYKSNAMTCGSCGFAWFPRTELIDGNGKAKTALILQNAQKIYHCYPTAYEKLIKLAKNEIYPACDNDEYILDVHGFLDDSGNLHNEIQNKILKLYNNGTLKDVDTKENE
jgi:hypothetical protein